MPDFNDPGKLGRRFGDAYEYLMRHFATESGKSTGQFTLQPKWAA
jgi:type I restriction-modification system DNA methylase subunit